MKKGKLMWLPGPGVSNIEVKPKECFKKWFEFKVVAKGQRHQTFVDGKKLFDEEDAAFKEGKFVDISDADVKGKWAIFFFYPADFTFVCPTELEDLADLYDDFKKLDVEIFSVSTDTHFSHKAWHDTSPAIGKINYYMVGDQSGTITNNFDVMRPGVGLADRATFLVDPDGVIQFMEITSEGVGRNATELLRKTKAAQYVRKNPGEVCPAKWEEGEKTLAPSLDLVGKI